MQILSLLASSHLSLGKLRCGSALPTSQPSSSAEQTSLSQRGVLSVTQRPGPTPLQTVPAPPPLWPPCIPGWQDHQVLLHPQTPTHPSKPHPPAPIANSMLGSQLLSFLSAQNLPPAPNSHTMLAEAQRTWAF